MKMKMSYITQLNNTIVNFLLFNTTEMILIIPKKQGNKSKQINTFSSKHIFLFESTFSLFTQKYEI